MTTLLPLRRPARSQCFTRQHARSDSLAALGPLDLTSKERRGAACCARSCEHGRTVGPRRRGPTAWSPSDRRSRPPPPRSRPLAPPASRAWPPAPAACKARVRPGRIGLERLPLGRRSPHEHARGPACRASPAQPGEVMNRSHLVGFLARGARGAAPQEDMRGAPRRDDPADERPGPRGACPSSPMSNDHDALFKIGFLEPRRGPQPAPRAAARGPARAPRPRLPRASQDRPLDPALAVRC